MRYRVLLVSPRGVYRARTVYPNLVVASVGSNSRPRTRRRRAGGDDLWRGCQYGDCPKDIRDKYTNNTVADNILKWGSLGVFLGGLGIGTGGGEAPVPETYVPWPRPPEDVGPTDSFIPRERPFQLPGADVPVRVGDPEPPPVLPDHDGNVFVNPAFEGDTISIEATDNVVIGDPVPAPEPVPVAPDTVPTEGVTRGDTFVFEHEMDGNVAPDRLPFFPKLSERPLSTPFQDVELRDLVPVGDVGPAVEETSFIDEVYVEDRPQSTVHITSTPARDVGRLYPPRDGYTVEVHNPLYDPADLDRILEGDLAGWERGSVEVGPLQTYGDGRTVTVGRTLRLPGMTLRSGTRTSVPVHLLGELSSVHGPEGIELRSMAPLGSEDVVVTGSRLTETSFAERSTVPWDGRAISASDVVDVSGPFDGGFVEVPLEDPFPEMEVEDEAFRATGGDGSVVVGLFRSPTPGPLSTLHAILPRPTPITPQTVGPDGSSDVVPMVPYLPGVAVEYVSYESIDPFLYGYRRRRRKRYRHVISYRWSH